MPLPVASRAESLAFLAEVAGPSVAKGAILRRPRIVGLVGRLGLDRRAVLRMQRLRDRYGPGPLMVRTPDRPTAVILAAEHVRRVLDGSPAPFATDSSEKRAALAHFEPAGVLISRPPARADRRRYNEAVLRPGHAAHPLADRFREIVGEELGVLLAGPGPRPLDWERFAPCFRRIVRRVTLGDGARDDTELTSQLDRLRGAANWAWLGPGRRRLRARFLARLGAHVARAEPGSLAAVMATVPAARSTEPVQQVPQWLFAFDAVALTVLRSLALLATHSEASARARAEPSLLRAVLLESLRLWPTTPLVLRETAAETVWDSGAMPAGSRVVIFAPFFHRDGRRLPYADRLALELWTAEAEGDWPLIPFSRGPAACPGRPLALLLGTELLARLFGSGAVVLRSRSGLDPARPLPAGLDPFALRFELRGA
ncbi:MAG TPA: cytochrome P450 [Gemmatimonadales bacterium]|nr:cytochrome P450 [Gemmatimonadales bacterium]